MASSDGQTATAGNRTKVDLVGVTDEAQMASYWETCSQKMAAVGGQSNNIAVITRVRPFNQVCRPTFQTSTSSRPAPSTPATYGLRSLHAMQREKDLKTYNCITMKVDDKENQQVWIQDPDKPDDEPNKVSERSLPPSPTNERTVTSHVDATPLSNPHLRTRRDPTDFLSP